MTGPGHLSPHVAKLLEKVNAKVAAAATLEQIRDLAARARADAQANKLSLAEISELVAVAEAKAQQVERLATRLAELAGEATDEP